MGTNVVQWSNLDDQVRYQPISGILPWTPAEITTALWLDADNSGQSDGVISQWDDLSGNSRHAAQASAPLQPTLSGSKIVVNQDIMESVVPSGTFPSSIQITAAFKKTGAAQSLETVATRTISNAARPLDVYNTTRYIIGGPLTSTADIRTLTSASILSTTANATHGKEWLNGSSILDLVHNQAYADLSSVITLGSRGDGALKFIGEWYEFIVTSELSTDDRQKVEGYLAWKWDGINGDTALVTALPALHPYKSLAPTI